jgi:hypothetical protein
MRFACWKDLMETNPTYRGIISGLALVLIGSCLLTMSVAVLFLAEAPLLAFLLMGIPALLTGGVAVLHGIGVIAARIEISDASIVLTVPKWRVFPMLPLRRLTLRWDEVLIVRYRREVYPLLAVPFFVLVSFPVDVFAIDTTKGRVVLGGRSIPGLRIAIEEITRRTGLVIRDEGELKLGLFRSLIRGTPPWGEGQQVRDP